MEAKTIKKVIQNVLRKMIDFWIDFGGQNAPKWTPRGGNRSSLFAHFSSPGPSWEPKWPPDPSQGLLGLPKPNFLTIFGQF